MKELLKRIRVFWLLTFRYRFRNVGEGFYCGKHLFIRPGTVSVGNHVFIGKNCHLAVCDLRIGNHVMFAPGVAVVGGDHAYKEVGVPVRDSGRGTEKAVVVEDDVWVGFGCVIMQGVTLGEGCIVAAGSVVTKSIEPYTIWAGNPARYLKDRFNSGEEAVLHSKKIGGKFNKS